MARGLKSLSSRVNLPPPPSSGTQAPLRRNLPRGWNLPPCSDQSAGEPPPLSTGAEHVQGWEVGGASRLADRQPWASSPSATEEQDHPGPRHRVHTHPIPVSIPVSDAPDPDQRPLVIALMGATASGKTALAIELAETLDLAVLSVDSRQLYRQMDVGTAKPTPAQRQRVRHELLDLRDPDQPINLQEFVQLAQEAIAAEHRRRGIAFLVGGTGLYLQALLAGLQPPAVPPQPQLRQQFVDLGQPLCHRLLLQADPEAGQRIMPLDAVRTQRALEVIYATGRPLSQQQRRNPPPWRIVELALDPPDLAERIGCRTQQLYADGLVAETEGLIGRYGADCPLLQTIGYGEARSLLLGELDHPTAIAISERRTRQFAKRQLTWFRRQHQPLWLHGADLLQKALLATRQGLG